MTVLLQLVDDDQNSLLRVYNVQCTEVVVVFIPLSTSELKIIHLP